MPAGRRRIFLTGLVIFVAGSIAAALAGSGAALIGSRVVQGIGGAVGVVALVAFVSFERLRNLAGRAVLLDLTLFAIPRSATATSPPRS
ncbi:MAG: hypothetical protein ACLQDY_01780 [Streptosporangiaceae bacterium]